MNVLNKFIVGILLAIVCLLAPCYAVPEIGPTIKANGTMGNVAVNYSDTVSITVEMNAGIYTGAPVDWWIVALAGSSWYYLNSLVQWTEFDGNLSNCHPVYQGGLCNLPATEVLNMTGLPIGSYTFWFAVDYPMDGILNLDGQILVDAVNVQSTPETVLHDDFNGTMMDANLWHIPTWVSPTDGTFVGRTQFRCSQNSPLPEVSGGNAIITVESYNPTGFSFYGTDLIGNQSFPLGQGLDITVRAKMNTSMPGIVGGIFLYALKPGSDTLHDKIDFELLTNLPHEPNTNIYGNEPLEAGHPQLVSYASGSTTDYHTYEIKWRPNQVSWLVDGNLVRTTTNNVPAGPMNFHLNMWVPGSSWAQAYSANIQPVSSASSNQVFSMSVDSVTVTVW